jgi:hypothetical protein
MDIMFSIAGKQTAPGVIVMIAILTRFLAIFDEKIGV